ncbi:hypothetical protein [Rhizomonospora bruguierae]|uniref:hypothetical protein n=1 Tax=Rhizomonospora bruguierae TaxID=1581705 RepID=UPI001BCDE617|nr:hypothetical protein [Micromonospora sp. NBRC 107566]
MSALAEKFDGMQLCRRRLLNALHENGRGLETMALLDHSRAEVDDVVELARQGLVRVIDRATRQWVDWMVLDRSRERAADEQFGVLLAPAGVAWLAADFATRAIRMAHGHRIGQLASSLGVDPEPVVELVKGGYLMAVDADGNEVPEHAVVLRRAHADADTWRLRTTEKGRWAIGWSG